MKVICFGDSNTYGYDPSSWYGRKYDKSWVDWSAKMTGWEFINAGENGREIPRRESEFYQLQQLGSSDLLIIMLGTNDLLQGASADIAAARMERLLNRLPLSKEKVLLIAPPSLEWGEWVAKQSLIDMSGKLGKCYHSLSQQLGILFISAQDWNIPIAFDGVHFTEEGHRIFAEKLCIHLRKGAFCSLPETVLPGSFGAGAAF